MANREKGHTTLVLGDRTYTLCVDMHAWALAQDALTKGDQVVPMELLAERLTAGHMLSIVAVLWAALQRYHAEAFPTLRHASELIGSSDGRAATALIKAVNQAAPDKADLRDLGVRPPNPPTAQNDGGPGAKQN